MFLGDFVKRIGLFLQRVFMVHIKITRGLDIPIKGKPGGRVQSIVLGGGATPLNAPLQLALDLQEFPDTKFKLLVKSGDSVKIGQPLLEDKTYPGRNFVSPAGGSVRDVRRGAKRVLLDIVIDVAKEEEYFQFSKIDISKASREEIIEALKQGGQFANIHTRPLNRLADPNAMPRSIFVKAIESAPFAPPAELQVEGHEKQFQAGLNALSKLTNGAVHLIYHHETKLKAFLDAENVRKHTAEGPHPIANYSLHIQRIDPIRSAQDVVWTINAHDVVGIGHFLTTGQYYTERVIGIGGPGVLPDKTGFYKVRQGFPVEALISGRVPKGLMRFISGDPLLGHKVGSEDFLGYSDFVFCVIPENVEREFMHFFRLGLNKYSFSRAYLSGHLNNADREYDFTTNQHGEHRAFVDSSLYDKVMPLEVPTMHLVKAVMAEDYELAETLGILEVDSEDFALPAFVCPSKMEMVDIMKNGIRQYAKEIT